MSTLALIKSLDQLITELYKAFESDVVDVDYVKMLLSAYKSNPKDWKKYSFFDTHRFVVITASPSDLILLFEGWRYFARQSQKRLQTHSYKLVTSKLCKQ
jgi:hypothetical protein